MSMAAVADNLNMSDSVKEVKTSMSQMIARTSLYSTFVKASPLPSYVDAVVMLYLYRLC